MCSTSGESATTQLNPKSPIRERGKERAVVKVQRLSSQRPDYDSVAGIPADHARRALLRPFEWKDDFPPVAEVDAEYQQALMKKWQEKLFN